MKSKWIVSGINEKKNVFRAYYFNDISFSITTALLGSVCACVCVPSLSVFWVVTISVRVCWTEKYLELTRRISTGLLTTFFLNSQ